MRKRKFIRLVGCILISYQTLFSQTTVSILPTADAEINQNGGGSFAGSLGAFQIYPWTPSYSKRAVIRFDLSIYTGCTINSAWMVLMEQSTNTISRQINVHRLTSTWSENSTHWTTPWSTSGGDYAATAVSSFTPSWTGTYKKDSVNLTTSVQSFVNGTYPNYGWLLKISSEDNTQQYWAYYSKETATASYRPILRIKYSGCSTLPIELLNFNAEAKNNKEVEITWQTASEVNNALFTIERSIDGMNWVERKQVTAAGNSSSILNYATTDENSYSGLLYYRLKQIDFDGHFSYSTVKAIDFSDLEKSAFILYPNPAQNQITINVSHLEQNDDFSIYNILGQNVTAQTTKIRVNENEFRLDIKKLPDGIYYIKSSTSSHQLIKGL